MTKLQEGLSFQVWQGIPAKSRHVVGLHSNVVHAREGCVMHRPGQSDITTGRHSPGLPWEGKVPAGSGSICQQGIRQSAACHISH